MSGAEDDQLVALGVGEHPPGRRVRVADEAPAGGEGRAHALLGDVVRDGHVDVDTVALRPGGVHLLEPHGGAAAGGVVALVCLVVMTYTFGALDALERMGGGRATISPLGVTTHLSVSHGTVGAEWQVRWGVVLAVLAAAALALLLTARVWRLRRR